MKTVLPERASPVTPRRTVGVIRSRRTAPALLSASAVAPVSSESRTEDCLSAPYVGRRKGPRQGRPETGSDPSPPSPQMMTDGLREGSDRLVELQRLAERGGGEAGVAAEAHVGAHLVGIGLAGERPGDQTVGAVAVRAAPRSAAAARRARRRAGRAAQASSCAGHRATVRRRAGRYTSCRTGVTSGSPNVMAGGAAGMLPVSSLGGAAARLRCGRRFRHDGDDARGGALLGGPLLGRGFSLVRRFLLRGRHRDQGNGRRRRRGQGADPLLERGKARLGVLVLGVALADRLLQAAQVLLHLAHGVLHIVDLGQRLVGDAQSLLRIDGWLRRLLLPRRRG